MKNIIATLAGFLLCAAAFAEAPELKNMMPNSWKKLTRLSEAEERGILESVQVKNDISTLKSVRESRIYKESVNGIDFYRVLNCNEAISDFLTGDYKDRTVSREDYDDFIRHKIQQIVYLKETSSKLVRLVDLEFRQFGATTGNHETDASAYFVFEDLFIKKLNKNEIGFFITEATIDFPLSFDDAPVDLVYGKIKNQQMGGNSCRFFKIRNDADIAAAFEECKRDFRYGISIDASTYLFDPKCPLRYSIQNAFDGDPATSYVENTEDDLILVEIGVSGNISRLAIINGYASNEYYYKVNNRVRGLSGDIDFADNNMRYQIIKCLGNYLQFDSIYKGELYNDTCLAELNLFVDNKWLFGDIDE